MPWKPTKAPHVIPSEMVPTLAEWAKEHDYCLPSDCDPEQKVAWALGGDGRPSEWGAARKTEPIMDLVTLFASRRAGRWASIYHGYAND